jgi:hypothetical protein
VQFHRQRLKRMHRFPKFTDWPQEEMQRQPQRTGKQQFRNDEIDAPAMPAFQPQIDVVACVGRAG